MYLGIIIVLIFISLYQFRKVQCQTKLLNEYDYIRKKLLETCKIISKINDEDKIYSIVLDTIIELIPNADFGSVLIYNNKEDKFLYKVIKGYNKELEKFSFKREETFLYKINKFTETAIIKNPLEFDKKNVHKDTVKGLEGIKALDISCTLSAPLYVDNRVIGLINVDSHIPNHVFTASDLNLMEQIKCELELVINNALAQNKLAHLANYDDLTNLVNRRMFKEKFDNELIKIRKKRKQMAVVMIDLDDFKDINDTYGHNFGDMVLKHFSNILTNLVRKEDVVARLAGDEFIIMFKEMDINMATSKMNAITEAVEMEPFEGVVMNFSYGIYSIGYKEDISFNKIVELADAQMYENKRIKAKR